MDELNKRVLTVMESKRMSRSVFASELDISLPVLTHISSGRNKPGLELIQKILTRFQDISPDWLLLGKGEMVREKLKKVDLSSEIQQIAKVGEELPQLSHLTRQVQEYHRLLLKEILYLNDLQQYLQRIDQTGQALTEDVKRIQERLEAKLSD